VHEYVAWVHQSDAAMRVDLLDGRSNTDLITV